MKKILFLSILAGLCLTGCTNDELVDGNGGQLSKSDYINFTFQQENMTRADKLSNTHYEFGVFADNDETVMDNYLVGWGDASSPYKALVAGATTYGDPTSQVDGLSYWFYEKLGTAEGKHTTYTIPEQDQILKFWDKSKDSYQFWAYAPYTLKLDAETGKNADNVTFQKGTDELLFTNLSSFYTSPVLKEDGTNKYQVTTADVAAANAADAAKYDAEMINYNEGLYAYKSVEKAHYGEDVPFTFNHINAKINLAFYEDIEGYSVEIMDMVPEAITKDGLTKKYDIAKQNGIVLTPATPEQAVYYDQTTKEYKQQTAQTDLAKYLAEAQVDIKDVSTTPTLVVGNASNTPKNDNLYFKPTTGSIATTNVGTTSATTLYVLPNHNGTNYITTDSAETSSTIVDQTGYTLHVSYKLIPADGSATVQMYDARVYIAPEYCQWQAGKAYKYIFKITLNANGTTDPANEDDKYTTEQDPSSAVTDAPYVDPTDPRVPDEGGLLPIVFDGIMVSDYADGGSPEFVITESDLETSFQKALASITETFSNGGSTASPTIAGGDGKASDSPFVVNYTVKVSDFAIPTGSTDVNDNNVFKDLQALSQAMYNQDGIHKIEYGGNTYTKSLDNSLNPPSWYYDGLSLESRIATKVYVTDLGETPENGNEATVEFTLKDGKTPENVTYVKLHLTVEAD